MGEQPRTEFDKPIPLRDKESRQRPNPYSRLEAAGGVLSRLLCLDRLVKESDQPVNPRRLHDVLQLLALDLGEALAGQDVDVVGAIADNHRCEHLAALLWPVGRDAPT